jgi:hypothetical protein
MKRLLLAAVLGLAGISPLWAQGYSFPPVLQPFQSAPGTPLVVPYSAGTITVGGFQTALPVGSITLADNQSNCGAPQFAACNIIYWTPTAPTVLSVTSNPSVAFSSGNTVVDYVTTMGGTVSSVVVASLTLEGTPGSQVGFATGGSSLLPICNPVILGFLKCQPRNQTLSGY